MCHLMPQQHLPELREEDEYTVVRGLNHIHLSLHRAFQSVIHHFVVTSCMQLIVAGISSVV